MPENTPFPFWTAEQAAALWGIDPRGVQRYCRLGRVPGATQIGGCWFVPVGTNKPKGTRGLYIREPGKKRKRRANMPPRPAPPTKTS